jgi:hypothetical protein
MTSKEILNYQIAGDYLSTYRSELERRSGPMPSRLLPPEVAEAICFTLKSAAKESNLTLRNGCLYTRNNQFHCRYFFIPGSRSTWVTQGQDTLKYSYDHVYVLALERIDSVPLYRLSHIETEYKDYSDVTKFFHLFSNTKNVTLNKSLLEAFLVHYSKELARMHLITETRYNGSYSWILDVGKDRIRNNLFDLFMLTQHAENPADEFISSSPCEADALCFTATVFSIVKPLFQLCRIKCDPNFVLQILLDPAQFSDEQKPKAMFHLELLLHFWCDFREWPVADGKPQKKKEYGFDIKFRNRYSDPLQKLRISHRNFPIAYFNYKKLSKLPLGSDLDEWDAESDSVRYTKRLKFNKAELQCLGKNEVLPILIPYEPPARNYARAQCLTVTLRTASTDIVKHCYAANLRHPDGTVTTARDTATDTHRRINNYYFMMVNALSELPFSQLKKMLRHAYREAQAEFGCLESQQDARQQQFACLLSSLYLVRDCFVKQDQPVQNLQHFIDAFLRVAGVASISTFANFVQQVVKQKSDVLFCCEPGSIYLHYAHYWPAYQKYCRSHNFTLSISAAAFRRDLLKPAGLITPQYQTSGGNYLRYDYRKEHNGQKATVLKLSDRILEYVSE